MADAATRFLAKDASNAARDVALAPSVMPNARDVTIEGPGPASRNTVDADEPLLDVGDLCRMFEESEESTYTARQESERDRDYVDNKQLTADELATLRKRGQPPQIDNRIKTKIDYLVGLEKQQGIDPKAMPRTPVHEDDADGATQALRYVADVEQFDYKRSGVWRNMLVEGAGGIAVAVKPSYDGQGVEVELRRIAWDRMFWDPHSAEPDFSDAGYLGAVVWMDLNDAKGLYPDGIEALENTLSSAPSDTYDDKPKYSLWADRKRKRVRICQIWLKRNDQWHFAEFTKGGILKAGQSPYVTDQGESDCELFFQSAYVDRDNNRYGLVREMITLQDGINKRHSKALHLLNTAQVWIDEDAIPADGLEVLRREAAKPDGTIVLAPQSMRNGAVKIETRQDLAAAQLGLLQEAKNAIDLKGPNATQMGDKAQGSASASGRAIIASQQGGMVSLGDLLDNLRHLDLRVFRAIWARIRQYWTQEKWIRITDDERNIKWVGMNVDPQKMQMLQMQAQQNPQMAEKIGGIIASVAELDCDIVIEESPDSVTPALEQWQGLVELAQAGVPIPPTVLIKAAPNLRKKDQLLKEMEEAAKNQPDPMQAEMAKAQMQAQIKQQEGAANIQLKREEAAANIELERQKTGAQIELERQKAIAQFELKQQENAAQMAMERERNENETNLTVHKMNVEAQTRAQIDEKSGKTAQQKEAAADLKALVAANEQTQRLLAELADDLGADVELVRDASGRAAGARRVRKPKQAVAG